MNEDFRVHTNRAAEALVRLDNLVGGKPLNELSAETMLKAVDLVAAANVHLADAYSFVCEARVAAVNRENDKNN